MDHLPPGAKKNVHIFKKGETLPDGSIAKGGEKMVTVTVDKGGGHEMAERRLTISQPGSEPIRRQSSP